MKPSPEVKYRVGVIGCGRAGTGRARAFDLHPLCAVAAIADTDADNLALGCERFGVPGYNTWEEMFASEEIDIAMPVLPVRPNADAVVASAEAGVKAIFCEKPFTNNLADAESLGPLVRDDSSNLVIGHIVLFNSEFLQLLEESRRQGPISYINCVRHRPASILEGFAGENPLHAAMVHDLYATQVLVDRAEPDHFSAQYHRTSAGAIDIALAQLAWKDGPVASFAASFATPAGMPPRGFDRTEVFGQGWSARIDPNPRPIEVWDEQARWPLALEIRAGEGAATGMMAEELRCFCRVARGESPVPTGASYQDALQVQRWMEKLDAAAQ